jgi:hypothetical protein
MPELTALTRIQIPMIMLVTPAVPIVLYAFSSIAVALQYELLRLRVVDPWIHYNRFHGKREEGI